MLDNYGAPSPIVHDSLIIVCHNCGRTRRAVRLVARLLPKDEEGKPYTEVCHECLNEERLARQRAGLQRRSRRSPPSHCLSQSPAASLAGDASFLLLARQRGSAVQAVDLI